MTQLLDLLPIWDMLPKDTALKAHDYDAEELGHADDDGNITVGYTAEHGQSGFPEARLPP